MEDITAVLRDEGFDAQAMVTGSGPARTILAVSKDEDIDLIMMASHGRGGVERTEYVMLGSVADHVLQETHCPVFLVPLKQETQGIEAR
jgi:nucleotide-binding universal stress UspA family protein